MVETLDNLFHSSSTTLLFLPLDVEQFFFSVHRSKDRPFRFRTRLKFYFELLFPLDESNISHRSSTYYPRVHVYSLRASLKRSLIDSSIDERKTSFAQSFSLRSFRRSIAVSHKSPIFRFIAMIGDRERGIARLALALPLFARAR